jgi:hypothetical protein
LDRMNQAWTFLLLDVFNEFVLSILTLILVRCFRPTFLCGLMCAVGFASTKELSTKDFTVILHLRGLVCHTSASPSPCTLLCVSCKFVKIRVETRPSKLCVCACVRHCVCMCACVCNAIHRSGQTTLDVIRKLDAKRIYLNV